MLLRGRALCATFQLLRRYQHFGSHARNVSTFRIVETDFQNDGLDVAFTAAHIALRSEISLSRLIKNFAVDKGTSGETDTQRVAQANVVCVSFRNGRTHP